METTEKCLSPEDARNQALRWLEIDHGVRFGPHYNRIIYIGKFGELAGLETGVGVLGEWFIRLDWDPMKGAHYNVGVGKGASGLKKAFCFDAPESLVRSLANRPRND